MKFTFKLIVFKRHVSNFIQDFLGNKFYIAASFLDRFNHFGHLNVLLIYKFWLHIYFHNFDFGRDWFKCFFNFFKLLISLLKSIHRFVNEMGDRRILIISFKHLAKLNKWRVIGCYFYESAEVISIGLLIISICISGDFNNQTQDHMMDGSAFDLVHAGHLKSIFFCILGW